MNSKRRFKAQATALAIGLLSTAFGHGGENDSRVNTIRPNVEAQVVKAQIDTKGAIHLLLQSKNGPQYVVSKDSGRTFSAPIAIVDESVRKPGLEFSGEDIVIGKDGRVFVAMSDNAWKLKLPVEEWGMFFATLDPEAKTFATTRNLNLKPSEGFSVAADKDGSVTACFLSGKLFAKVVREGFT